MHFRLGARRARVKVKSRRVRPMTILERVALHYETKIE